MPVPISVMKRAPFRSSKAMLVGVIRQDEIMLGVAIGELKRNNGQVAIVLRRRIPIREIEVWCCREHLATKRQSQQSSP